MWLTDPSYVLAPPQRSSTLPPGLWTKLTVALATQFTKTASAICKLIPRTIKIVKYGWICRLDGGNNIQAWELVPFAADRQDMLFVQVRQTYHLCICIYTQSLIF